MRLSQVTGSSRRENGSWLLLSETLHWAADPVDWLSNAVSRRVGPQLQPKQAGGQGVGRAGRGLGEQAGEPLALLKLWRLL